MYRLELTPAGVRDLEGLKKRIQKIDFERLRAEIGSLANEPRPHNVRKIRGAEGVCRIKTGSYRVVYEINDDAKMVLILHISRRTEATYKPW
jgi:mRNA interferase RelE/StbE